MLRTVADPCYVAGKIIEALIGDYSDWAWGYINWGNVFWLAKSPQTSPDFDRARFVYQKGLDACVEEADEIRERLNDLAEKSRPGLVLGDRGTVNRPPVPLVRTLDADNLVYRQPGHISNIFDINTPA